MNTSSEVQELVAEQSRLCLDHRKQLVMWLLGLLCFICVVVYVNTHTPFPANLPVEFVYIALIMGLPILLASALKGRKYLNSQSYLADYNQMRVRLEGASTDLSVKDIGKLLSEAAALAKTNHLVPGLLEHHLPILHRRMTILHRQSLLAALDTEHAALELSSKSQMYDRYQQVPLIKTRNQISTSLAFLERRRKEMTAQWEAAYKTFSWWNKLKYGGGPDFTEIDKAIKGLSGLQRRLVNTDAEDFERLEEHFRKLEQRALSRLAEAKTKAAIHIQELDYQESLSSGLLKKAFWFSAMSVPISIWSDLDSATNVYSALRGVNSNFAAMSDSEIWWESLFMPAESLAGLAALTKGAYFEQLVAADSGGQLFEHFNNPDTDIVIDGIAFQLKATDSAAYVYSVDESIPVIATSEVALTTGAIDSGYSNEDLTNAVGNALGGTVIDVGDTLADAILTGVGGLGFFATIEGINHATKKYENGGDAVEAAFEGAGVAIEGTARALVGAAEMSYNVLTSRPSRFVGRVLLSGLKKFDDKMMAAGDKK
ncbi:hypothetical protein N9K37_03460 [Pseudomonadales bacterium]|nr:hypothetical protein [Pseudomonadales bacterium]